MDVIRVIPVIKLSLKDVFATFDWMLASAWVERRVMIGFPRLGDAMAFSNWSIKPMPES